MKKLFTLLTLALMSIGSAWAEDVVLYWGVETAANSITVNDFTITITGNNTKNWSGGNGNITYETKSYKTLKNSNGAQNTITCPEGRTATAITFYVVSNADSPGILSEFDGETCSHEVTSTKDYENPTKIEKSIANKSEFTFTFSTKQVCFIAVVTLAPSSAPSISASKESMTFGLTPAKQTDTQTFTLTGKNLTDGSYDLTVPSVDGLSVSPTSFTVADGEVEQEFEVTYTSDVDVAANSATISATVDGESFEVTVNYSARTTPYEQTDVTGTATWDWTKLKETVELGAETTPIKDTEVLLAEFDSQIDFSAFGNAQAIVFKGQFPSRNGFAQGSMLKFTTTVSGTITVEYSNTGGSNKNRWLTVNGIQFGDEAVGTTKRSATSHVLPAGDIVISTTSAYLRFFTVTFTPAEMPTTASATIGTEGWATLYTYYNLDFSTVEGLTAYTATVSENTVTLTEVENVPANTGVVLKGEATTYNIPITASSETAQGDLQGAATTTAFDAFDGYTLYVLTKESEKDAQFAPVNAGSIAAGKAFLKVAAGGSSRLNVVFAGETTGIKTIEAQEAQEGIYNLQGQRVAKAQKGLYIVNGKKAIVK